MRRPERPLAQQPAARRNQTRDRMDGGGLQRLVEASGGRMAAGGARAWSCPHPAGQSSAGCGRPPRPLPARGARTPGRVSRTGRLVVVDDLAGDGGGGGAASRHECWLNSPTAFDQRACTAAGEALRRPRPPPDYRQAAAAPRAPCVARPRQSAAPPARDGWCRPATVRRR